MFSLTLAPTTQLETMALVMVTVATTIPFVSACVSVTVLKTLPVTTPPSSAGLHSSNRFETARSCMFAFPAPAPEPVLNEPEFDAPHDQLSTEKVPAPMLVLHDNPFTAIVMD